MFPIACFAYYKRSFPKSITLPFRKQKLSFRLHRFPSNLSRSAPSSTAGPPTAAPCRLPLASPPSDHDTLLLSPPLLHSSKFRLLLAPAAGFCLETPTGQPSLSAESPPPFHSNIQKQTKITLNSWFQQASRDLELGRAAGKTGDSVCDRGGPVRLVGIFHSLLTLPDSSCLC